MKNYVQHPTQYPVFKLQKKFYYVAQEVLQDCNKEKDAMRFWSVLFLVASLKMSELFLARSHFSPIFLIFVMVFIALVINNKAYCSCPSCLVSFINVLCWGLVLLLILPQISERKNGKKNHKDKKKVCNGIKHMHYFPIII